MNVPRIRIALFLVPIVLALGLGSGCHSYTGIVKKEFVREERVDEVVVQDELSLKAEHRPVPGKAYFDLEIRWDLQREFHLQKIHHVYREYLPFEPIFEVLEILSAPFLFLTVLPTSLLVAPIELTASPKVDEAGDFLFVRMALLPFKFLNPGVNADEWGRKSNVYGKVPAFEDCGLEMDEKGPKQTEERHEGVEGADLDVEIPQLGRRLKLKTGPGGRTRNGR
jgi:hypothetical protein